MDVKINPEKSYTTKAGENFPYGSSASMIWTFDYKKIRDDCMKQFCGFFKEHSVKTIKFEKK